MKQVANINRAALLLIAILLLTLEYHQLWKIQELNLFLWTPLFFKQQMVVAGGLLTWLGTFFTQFLYQPWIGVLMLCAWWWLLMWLLKRAFRITDRWTPTLLIPVALLLIADMSMGYWIYTLKLRGWFFLPTIGTTAVAALLWAYRALPARRGLRRVFLVGAVVAGYPLLGTYALAAALLMALWSWRLEPRRTTAAATTLLALVSVIAVPLLYYRYVYYQTNLVNIYWTAMPTFRILDTYFYHYLPYILLAAFLLLLTVAPRPLPQRLHAGRTPLVLQGVMLLLLAVATWLSWFKDENYHHEVAMQHYVEQVRWDKVVQEATRQSDEPTRAVVLLRNLALARLGRQGDDMYRFPNGSRRPASDFPVQSGLIVGSMLYYNYGLLNDSHHLCLESAVEYGWRISHLTYIARAAMLNGDIKAMKKFTGLLKHTLYYDQWAQQLESLQRDPDRMAEALETAPVLHMMHYNDMAGADKGYAEKYLMGILSQMDSDDPYCQEQCLLAAMWTKDAKRFWPRFIQYCRQHPTDRMPRHFQEAACLFSMQRNANFQTMPVDNNIKLRYQEFMKQLKALDGKDLFTVQRALYPQFGDTYFYDYYLMNNLIYL